MKEKHGIEHGLIQQDGLVTKLGLSQTADEQLKEIKSTLEWTVKRVLENREKKVSDKRE